MGTAAFLMLTKSGADKWQGGCLLPSHFCVEILLAPLTTCDHSVSFFRAKGCQEKEKGYQKRFHPEMQ